MHWNYCTQNLVQPSGLAEAGRAGCSSHWPSFGHVWNCRSSCAWEISIFRGTSSRNGAWFISRFDYQDKSAKKEPRCCHIEPYLHKHTHTYIYMYSCCLKPCVFLTAETEGAVSWPTTSCQGGSGTCCDCDDCDDCDEYGSSVKTSTASWANQHQPPSRRPGAAKRQAVDVWFGYRSQIGYLQNS